jgi:hypothetical protein
VEARNRSFRVEIRAVPFRNSRKQSALSFARDPNGAGVIAMTSLSQIRGDFFWDHQHLAASMVAFKGRNYTD